VPEPESDEAASERRGSSAALSTHRLRRRAADLAGISLLTEADTRKMARARAQGRAKARLRKREGNRSHAT
jgi:hypothetical protein